MTTIGNLLLDGPLRRRAKDREKTLPTINSEMARAQTAPVPLPVEEHPPRQNLTPPVEDRQPRRLSEVAAMDGALRRPSLAGIDLAMRRPSVVVGMDARRGSIVVGDRRSSIISNGADGRRPSIALVAPGNARAEPVVSGNQGIVELDKAQHDLKKLHAENRELRNKLAVIKRTPFTEEELNFKRDVEVESLRGRIVDLEQRLDDARAVLVADKEGESNEMTRLRKVVSQMQEESKAMSAVKQHAERRFIAESRAGDSVKESMAREQLRYSEFQGEATARIHSLERELFAVKAELTEAQKLINQWEQDRMARAQTFADAATKAQTEVLERMQLKVAKHEKRQADAERLNTRLLREIENLKSSNQRLSQLMDKLKRNNVAATEQTHEDHEERVRQAHEEMEAQATLVARWQERCNQLRVKYEDAVKERENLNVELRGSRRDGDMQLRNLQMRLETVEGELAAEKMRTNPEPSDVMKLLHEKVSYWLFKYKASKVDIDQLKLTKQELEEEIQILKRDLRTARNQTSEPTSANVSTGVLPPAPGPMPAPAEKAKTKSVTIAEAPGKRTPSPTKRARSPKKRQAPTATSSDDDDAALMEEAKRFSSRPSTWVAPYSPIRR